MLFLEGIIWLFEDVVFDLRKLDDLVATDPEPVSTSVYGMRSFAQSLIWDQLHIKESMIRQKSRYKWLKEGDQNSKFFHAYLKARHGRNNILVLGIVIYSFKMLRGLKIVCLTISILYFKNQTFQDQGLKLLTLTI